MIKHTGIFPHNAYYERSYALDKVKPQGMEKTAACVLAIDTSARPLTRKMDYDTAQAAHVPQIEAFHARFKDIDPNDPGFLPLQMYDGQPAVCRTVQNLLDAKVASVTVACADKIYDEVQAVLCGMNVRVVRYDHDAIFAIDKQSDGLLIDLISRGQILWADHLCATRNSDAMLIIHADQVDFEPRHFCKLRSVFEQDPSLDFVSSYVEWRSGTPLLFGRALIDKLAKPLEGVQRPVQGSHTLACRLFKTRHAIMGEEKIFGPNPLPVEATKPGALPQSAQAVVVAARHVASREERHQAKVDGKKPNKFVEDARAFLGRLDALLEAKPIADLGKADAWARRLRSDFPIFATRDNANLVYLDAAATALQPSCVIHACREFSTHFDANIWRGFYGNSMFATSAYQAAREKIARFINADPRDCIFTTNTTDSINLVAHGWAQRNLNEGDLVCVMINEHHSNLVPWLELAEHIGCQLAYIKINESGRIDWPNYNNLLERKPKLIAAAQISNVIGIKNPIPKMAHLAHEVGAAFLVDAAQSAPHIALDVQKLDVDFLAFSGHKLQGPTGIGVLWAAPQRVAEMMPVVCGGGTISEVSFDGTYYRQSPYCFEPGTPPIEQAIGLGAAVDYLSGLGMDAVEAHVRAMSAYALRVASLIEGVGIWGRHTGRDGALGLISYQMKTLDAEQVSMLLARMGISTRAGTHCAIPFVCALGTTGTVRISFGPYTTKSDIEAWGWATHRLAQLCRSEVPRS